MPHYLNIVLLPFHYFIEANQRIFWNNLLSAFLVGAVIYLFNKQNQQRKSFVGLFNYLFPVNVYLHKSAINDYLFFFTNTILFAAFITPFFSIVSNNTAIVANNLFSHFFPLLQNSLDGKRLYLIFAFTLVLGLVTDFAIFLMHYLQHRIPLLWEFHKVHHSAEVLTPITVYRMHPVDDILTFSLSGILFGTTLGFLQFLFKPEIIMLNIYGTNLIFILFHLCLVNLRHTHIWISYGPFWSKLFISPAQHQIHHSMDSKHFDKNMGLIFAFWDNLFGTLYIPVQKEQLRFGINQQENAKFSTFWSLYLMPFINVFNNFSRKFFTKLSPYLSLFVILSITIPAAYFSNLPLNQVATIKSLFLEDMTWEEVHQAIGHGKTTVLIPTGGTEQNGPHVILGKHNYIVRFTAEKIAEQLGNTLIAPIMAYVPEGNINPPEGHMRFAGTLSIPEITFSEVLEATAKSLKTHGFRVIAFVGDSGGNQDAQKSVAGRLNELWQAEGIRVVQVDAYYSDNGQVNYLLNQGLTQQKIGGHAGIRDTSELMAVHPEGIRMNLLADRPKADANTSGADGDTTLANAELGKTLLNLKINAAVNQLKALEINPNVH